MIPTNLRTPSPARPRSARIAGAAERCALRPPRRALRPSKRNATAVAAIVVAVLVAAATTACAPRPRLRSRPVRTTLPSAPASTFYVPWGEYSESSRMVEIGPRARLRWRRWFANAAMAYPPPNVVLVAFKKEKRLEVYAGFAPRNLTFVRSIAITAASGGPGPKLREGDGQVPEGVYRVESLNPNSNFHVSLRLDYPNLHDQLMALRDGRRRLGGDIMIHGSDRSIGCLAVGDQAAEDLFVLSADAGLDNVAVWILPRDFRRTGEAAAPPGQPQWVRELYVDLDRRLHGLPVAAPIASGRAAAARGRIAPVSQTVRRER